jgi:hypothetical protein
VSASAREIARMACLPERTFFGSMTIQMVCHGDIDLAQAQEKIAHDWTAAYQAWVPKYPHYLPKGRREFSD